MYAVLCHASGGAVDDLLVYRFAPDHFMLVVNASNRAQGLGARAQASSRRVASTAR